MNIESPATKTDFIARGHGPVAISVWEDVPKVEHARTAVDLLHRLAREHEGIGLIAILGDGCAMPDEHVRAVLAEGIVTVSSKIVAVANVVEGQGFRGAAIRGVLTSLALVMSPSYPQRAFADVPSAAAFIERYSRGTVRGAELHREISALRRGGSG